METKLNITVEELADWLCRRRTDWIPSVRSGGTPCELQRLAEQQIQESIAQARRMLAAEALAEAILAAPPGHSYRGARFGPPNTKDWNSIVALAHKVQRLAVDGRGEPNDTPGT